MNLQTILNRIQALEKRIEVVEARELSGDPLADLKARIEAIEAKRGPGRPKGETNVG